MRAGNRAVFINRDGTMARDVPYCRRPEDFELFPNTPKAIRLLNQSGFRAYSKKVFETFPLSEKGMSVSIETLEKARRKGFVIKETPISCRYTPSRLNIKAIRHGLGVALSVVRIRLKNSLFRRGKGEI